MSRVFLEADRLRAEVVPELGAGLASLDLRGPDGAWWALLRRAAPRVSWFNDLACYFLVPWPNRIAEGRFVWRGREHCVAPDWPDGTAIHGLVKDNAWRIVERTPVSAVLGFDGADRIGAGWPWRFACRARYELRPDGVKIGLCVRNLAAESMPAGLGFHPFFPRRLWDEGDDVKIHYPASGRYPAARMIPTGRAEQDGITQAMAHGITLGGRYLDDVFLGSTDGAEIVWPASRVRARFACSERLGHGVVYTGEADRPELSFFCFEPVTMVNNGFNLAAAGVPGTGVVELEPGGELAVEWALHIGTI